LIDPVFGIDFGLVTLRGGSLSEGSDLKKG